MTPFGAKLLDCEAHQRANGIQCVDFASGMPTDIAMALLGPLAQLAHVSEHQNGAPGKAGEYIHRSAHGYRVGVVTVIDHPHAIWRQLRDSTALDRLQIL